MLIENFIKKRDIFSRFYFDYALDEDNRIFMSFLGGVKNRKELYPIWRDNHL